MTHLSREQFEDAVGEALDAVPQRFLDRLDNVVFQVEEEADAETLARLEGEGLIAFRYADAHGTVGGPANPNGSINDIAGIMNASGNVLGLMPHPENLIESAHGGDDGRGIFESVLARAA